MPYKSRYKKLQEISNGYDEEPAQFNTASVVIQNNDGPICSGIMDCDGTYFYRYSERVKMGYIKY